MPSRESPPAAAVDASGVASAVFTVLAVCAVVVVLDAGVVVPVVVLFFLVVLVLVGVVVGVSGFFVSSPFPGSGFSGSFGVSVFSKIAYTSRSSLTSVSAVTVSPVPSALVFQPLNV